MSRRATIKAPEAAAATAAAPAVPPAQKISDMQRAVEYLRDAGRSGLQMHQGMLSGKSRPFFRGKRAIAVLTSEAYAKARTAPASLLDKILENINTFGKPIRTIDDLPPMPLIESPSEARALLNKMLKTGVFMPCERYQAPGGQRMLKLIQSSSVPAFDDEQYYVWQIDEQQRWATVIAVSIVLGVLLICLFPMWPWQLRVGTWYISMTLVAVLSAFLVFLITIRPLFWLISSFIVPPGIWILPNINEDIGFFESFKPVWALGPWENPPPAKKDKDAQ